MSLKTKNLPSVTAFVVLNYIAFAFVNHLPWQFFKEVDYYSESTLLFKNPLIAIGVHLGILILCFIIPTRLKYLIIFWRLKNPLPGSRVFTELVAEDPRIDIKELENRYGKLPTDPKAQNALWYKIYKENEDEKIINSSHGHWLLFREIAVLSAIIVLLLVPISLSINVGKGSIIYVFSMMAQYLILRQAAVNAAERFTCNVLAR
jgi:hypothetical protein